MEKSLRMVFPVEHYREKAGGRPNCLYKQPRADSSYGLSRSALHPSSWYAMTLYSCIVIMLLESAGSCVCLILMCELVDRIDTLLLEHQDNLDAINSRDCRESSRKLTLKVRKQNVII